MCFQFNPTQPKNNERSRVMSTNFHSLMNLKSLDNEKIECFRELGINNLGDLLAFSPFRHARLVGAARDQLLNRDEIVEYLDKPHRDKKLSDILQSSPQILKGLGRKTNSILKRLGIQTIDDLASFIPFSEAEEIVSRAPDEDNDPFAPGCVLPTCKKFTRNSKSFVSFFKHEEIRDLSVLSSGNTLIANLFRFTGPQPKVIYLGYSVSYLQEWIFCGVHLGEPQGSVNLFMGQDTQISILDWRRAIRAFRTEDTRVAERLTSTLFHQRAVDEVARATAEEHQHGGTSSFGANAATAGSFVAAGAVVGGVGGGISGALTGLAVDALVGGTDLGLGTLSGAAVGTAVGSVAGAAAGSLIFSGATTLGFVETDAEGDREIFAVSAQNIQQRTIQNSSSIRSFWSNIISQNVQDEQQQVRTDRVTNHNRIHALNALYFEVLNEYRVNIRANDVAPILLLPFKPIHFTKNILRRYWWLIRTFMNDKKLVLALDQHFLTLSSEPSPATEIAELPDIDEIRTDEVIVEVNLDGSAMEDILLGLFLLALPTGGMTAIMGAFYFAFNASKRENIKVSLMTSEGTIELDRESSPNLDPNFIGRYITDRRVKVHTIEKVKIKNNNAEFDVLGADLSELAFENISTQISIRNKNSFRDALPNIGVLENIEMIRPTTLKVGANRSKNISWDIGDRLRDQFEGINEAREELEVELSADELTAAKIEKLLGFLNANKFGFTRLILQNIEREQVISVLEEVEIGGVDLSSIASVMPIGFCGNHVVLSLKKCSESGANLDPISFDTSKLMLQLLGFDDVNPKNTQALMGYLNALKVFLNEFIQAHSSEINSARDQQLIDRLKALEVILVRFIDSVDPLVTGRSPAINPAVIAILQTFINEIARRINSIVAFLSTLVQTNNADASKLCSYFDEVKQSLEGKIGELIRSDEVSLPSPAVFMEPVLSNAKGAELYDMRRNSHYDILPSPDINAADPNVLRGQDIQLTPNVPQSTLTIQNAPEFPLPSSINTALAEAGKLDLSTLISSNAETLTSTLSNLSAVATELAKASAQLTGDAQKQALASAGEVAKQISGIIGKSLQPTSAAPPAPKPGPPNGQQEKAEVVRELKRINKGGGSKKEKKEKKETVGAPVAPDDTRQYQMSILFLDENTIPYPEGEFTLSMSFFELGSTFDINGGVPISLTNGQFFFPDTFTLKKGRMATIQISASIASVNISGIKEFILPDKPDIVFKCTMLSETHTISTTDVKSAVDQAVENSSFGAALNPILSQFLNAGIEFPFRIFEISADGGGKAELNLRLEYNQSSSSTSTTTTGNTTVKTFEVTVPQNGWTIEVV